MYMVLIYFRLLIVNNLLLNLRMTFKLWYYIAEECIQFYGYIKFGGIAAAVFHFSVIMHSFQNFVSDSVELAVNEGI